jgi:hypothetical protein
VFSEFYNSFDFLLLWNQFFISQYSFN